MFFLVSVVSKARPLCSQRLASGRKVHILVGSLFVQNASSSKEAFVPPLQPIGYDSNNIVSEAAPLKVYLFC